MAVERERVEQKDQKIGKYEDGSEQVIGALIEVHRALGPGLLESAYEACFAHELRLRGLAFERQRPVGIAFGASRSHSLNLPDLLDLSVSSLPAREDLGVPPLPAESRH